MTKETDERFDKMDKDTNRQVKSDDRRWKAIGAWIVIFTFIVGYALFQSHNTTEKLKKSDQRIKAVVLQNRDSLVKIEKLQRENKLSCDNYLVLRDTVNNYHGVLDSLLGQNIVLLRRQYQESHISRYRDALQASERLKKSIHLVDKDCRGKKKQ